MKNTHDDQVYLQHILDCIRMVQSFTAGHMEDFHTAPEKWLATIRALQIMSESATRLSDTTKTSMPEIEWDRIRGFRNLLVHDYLGDIDPMIIRKVIEIELPKLEKAIRRIQK